MPLADGVAESVPGLRRSRGPGVSVEGVEDVM